MQEDSRGNNSGEDDQRYLPRWETKQEVIFKLGDSSNPIHAETKDLSCAGARIRCFEPLEALQDVELTINLSNEKSIKVQGRIVWSQQSIQGLEAGVHFTDIDVDTQEEILNHAFELNKDQVMKHWYKGWEGSN